MNVLFVHNNFPAQFRNLAMHLARFPEHKVAAIGAEGAQPLNNVILRRYRMPYFNVAGTHPFARRFDVECRRAEQVLFAISELKAKGFVADVIVGHCGWGETLPLRAAFPKARIATYCEFYYRAEGQDVHFDPESPQLGVDGVVTLHSKNASTLLALADADLGISPTWWQRHTYPDEFHHKIAVAHEGVDMEKLRPDLEARFALPDGAVLNRSQEVVTFVARNLEPTRGYHIFMRALPEILRARPRAQIVIVGGDGVSYGDAAPEGTTWKSFYFNEVASRLDVNRVHFLPPLAYDDYVRLLQVSRAHVYLTYPFVLSWSLVEAMAVGCTIIGSDTPPVQEVIEHGYNGWLTPFHDSAALAHSVIKALAEPQSVASFGEAARAVAFERYEKQACIKNALAVLGIDVEPQGVD
jgi:glycosyltransferase involved in cell wall biosynthesis